MNFPEMRLSVPACGHDGILHRRGGRYLVSGFQMVVIDLNIGYGIKKLIYNVNIFVCIL